MQEPEVNSNPNGLMELDELKIDTKPYGFVGFLMTVVAPFLAIYLFFKNKFIAVKNNPKESFKKFGLFLMAPILWVFNKVKNFALKWKERAIAFKKHPRTFLKCMSSLVIPGSGHAFNKRWKKAAVVFSIFLVILLFELSSGRYFSYFSEIASHPAGDDGQLHFFRDYGGFFGKGLWGLFTLGKVALFDSYRGGTSSLVSFDLPWMAADNSASLLGQGVISLAFFLIVLAFWHSQLKDMWSSDMKIINGTERKETVKQYLLRTWDQYFAYILVIPAFILLILFTIIPFLFSFLIAFTSMKSTVYFPETIATWQLFDVFKDVFTDTELMVYFLDVFKWTLFYAIMASITVYILGFIHALVINSPVVKKKKKWRLLMILPWAIPGMISLMVFKQMFDSSTGGFANLFLYEYGMFDGFKEFMINIGFMSKGYANAEYISWFGEGNAGLAKTLIILVNLWLGSPYFMMLIIGILGTIPGSLYEAASIDGATNKQKFRFITLPWVLKATTPIIITTFTFNFNNFGAIYFLSGGGPSRTDIPDALAGRLQTVPGETDILISWIYKISFGGSTPEYNVAAVYSILIFIGISTIAIWSLARVKSFWEED